MFRMFLKDDDTDNRITAPLLVVFDRTIEVKLNYEHDVTNIVLTPLLLL